MSKQTAKSDSKFQQIVLLSLQIYPVIAHLGILFDQVIWAVSYLLVAVYLNSLKWLSRRNNLDKYALTIVFAFLLYVLFDFELQTIIVYLPPVLIPAWLAVVFLGSLRTEHAFITQIAERIEGEPLDARHLLYTRRLTTIWGCVFILMIVEALVLAIWASFDLWSWWVHIGNYFIVATLFLGEMLLRPLFIGQRAKVFQMFKELLQRNWNGQKNK